MRARVSSITEEWRAQGERADEPVEVWRDPHNKSGYRKEHDLTLPAVKDKHRSDLEQGVFNVPWYSMPCTSFCDWNIDNGGTRTWERPEGRAPVKESEALGNDLARLAAEMFAKSLDLGLFPVAESSAPSRNPNRRYPKMWDLSEWQEILGRPDVDFVDFPMCAYGLGPSDEPNAFYQHWTRLVFRKAPKMKQILARQCPGVSASHRHIPLKGSRPGASVTRCTEAGVYAKCFCTQVLGAVRMVVAPCSSEKGGGQAEATDTGAECGRLPEGCHAMERRPVSGRRDWNQADSDEALLRDHERRKKWSEENDRNCPHLCWGCYEVHIRNKHNWVGFCPWCRENDLVHELEHPFTKTECDECMQVSQEADGAESGPDEKEDGKAGGAYVAKN